jgi:hypothetical protein
MEMEPFIPVTRIQSCLDWHGARIFWFNAFGLLFSEGDHNYGLGGNIEKCLIDVDLRPGRRGAKNIFSLFYCLHCAYTETGWKGDGV